MITVTVIFGRLAVRGYEETNDLSAIQKMDGTEGTVKEIIFNTMEEYDAYSKGLSDADGWEEILMLPPQVKETADCPCCDGWRHHFRDNENNVYCPACGKLILSKLDYDRIEYDNQIYPVRYITMPGDTQQSMIATEALQDTLLKDDAPVNEEAEKVDELIFFYVSEQEFRLRDEDLILTIQRNL